MLKVNDCLHNFRTRVVIHHSTATENSVYVIREGTLSLSLCPRAEGKKRGSADQRERECVCMNCFMISNGFVEFLSNDLQCRNESKLLLNFLNNYLQ